MITDAKLGEKLVLRMSFFFFILICHCFVVGSDIDDLPIVCMPVVTWGSAWPTAGAHECY